MTICERMFNELDQRGLTAYGLCKHLGVNTNTTTSWKQRGTDPPAKYIAQICEFLGCSVEYLLTGADTRQPHPDGMTDDERELLNLYRSLSERDRILLLGRLQEMDHPLLGGK